VTAKDIHGKPRGCGGLWLIERQSCTFGPRSAPSIKSIRLERQKVRFDERVERHLAQRPLPRTTAVLVRMSIANPASPDTKRGFV